jgi:hypothetical protein
MIVVVVALFKGVGGAEVEVAEWVPADGGGVFLSKAFVVGGSIEDVCGGGDIIPIFVEVAATLEPVGAGGEDPVGEAGVAEFEGFGDVEEAAVGGGFLEVGREGDSGLAEAGVAIEVLFFDACGRDDGEGFVGEVEEVEVDDVLREL